VTIAAHENLVVSLRIERWFGAAGVATGAIDCQNAISAAQTSSQCLRICLAE
jgi:hypothetical protein